MGRDARVRYLLRLADTSLVLAQQLGEWVGHAPALEEDLGLANVSLDLLGQARLLYACAGELEGCGRDENALAFLREEADFLNVTLAEQPNGDFGDTIVRQFLLDAWQLELYERLQHSTDVRLAAIAAKSLKETRYHVRYSGGWLVRLGDGTAESHSRVGAALQRLWPYTRELCDADELDRQMQAVGIAPDLSGLRDAWLRRVDATLHEAGLERPSDTPYAWYGKQGSHSEHLGRLLALMQYLPRVHAGARW
ncbi:MAG: phenylacetate-CoA oxygenase subunit PaaC [Gammaproteobacteria bacterium]|nr:phenylacetate-CoA oxygenase subunit PaaC [Gammaproteobacteria bacterium]